MRSPWNIKEVQRLNGKLAALSRFLPRLTEKDKPLLKVSQQYHLDNECKAMFQNIKNDIASWPLLVSLRSGVDRVVPNIARTAVSKVESSSRSISQVKP